MFKKTAAVCFTAFLTFASCVNGEIPVGTIGSLDSAILTANKTPDTIKFFLAFVSNSGTYLQPFNADEVLNPLNNGGYTIDGEYTPGSRAVLNQFGSAARGFFARTSASPITIKKLIIRDGNATGGNGGTRRGGGGLGAGGGLFLNTGSSVILEDVSFENCSATGGNGGD